MSIWSTSSTRWEAASPENHIRLLKHRGRRGTQKRSFAAFLLEAEPARPRKPIARKRGAGAHCVPGGTPAGRMPPQSSGGKAAGTCAPGFRIQTSAVSRRPLPIYGGASFFWENVLKKRLFTASFRAICSYRPRALCSRAVNSSFPQTTGTG